MVNCINPISSRNAVTLSILKQAASHLVYCVHNDISYLYNDSCDNELLFSIPFLNTCLEIIIMIVFRMFSYVSQFHKSKTVLKTRTLSIGGSSVDLYCKSFRWGEHLRAAPDYCFP